MAELAGLAMDLRTRGGVLGQKLENVEVFICRLFTIPQENNQPIFLFKPESLTSSR